MGVKATWTRDMIADIIRGFSSIKQFRKKYSGAYEAMVRNGWTDLKELVVRTVPLPDNSPKWTRERISELALGCSSIKEFSKKYPRAYEKVKQKRWFDLLDGIRHNAPAVTWTRDKIKEIIDKCDSLYEFRMEYTTAYQAMLKNGWHDLASDLSRVLVTANEIREWCVYRWYFPEKNAVYIGLTKEFAQRIKNELRYSVTSPIKDFLAETGCSYEVNELYTGLTGEEAARLEIETIQKSREAGYMVLNRNRGGTMGGGRTEPDCTKVYIIAKYDKNGKYCGCTMYEGRRVAAETEAMRIEMDGACSMASVIPVKIPWRNDANTPDG